MHSIRQIEVVKGLAKHRHFGLAAEALGISQPALTRSLKQLEADLGVPLFDRRGVTPTPFGEIVLRHGQKAVTEFQDLMREIRLARGAEIGELHIAAGPYSAHISAERVIGLLTAQRPMLTIELRIANWAHVVAELLEGTVDLAFADISEYQQEADLDVETVRNSPLAFYCRAGHPLADKRYLTIENLLEFPWVGPSIPRRVRRALPAVDKPFGRFDASSHQFHPRVLVETFSAAKLIVLAGSGIGAALPFQIEPELSDGRCVLLPVEAPWLSLNYGFITKRGRTLSPAAKTFMETVRQFEAALPQ
jgi:DNA-binding transcriptional LysR family regulator